MPPKHSSLHQHPTSFPIFPFNLSNPIYCNGCSADPKLRCCQGNDTSIHSSSRLFLHLWTCLITCFYSQQWPWFLRCHVKFLHALPQFHYIYHLQYYSGLPTLAVLALMATMKTSTLIVSYATDTEEEHTNNCLHFEKRKKSSLPRRHDRRITPFLLSSFTAQFIPYRQDRKEKSGLPFYVVLVLCASLR